MCNGRAAYSSASSFRLITSRSDRALMTTSTTTTTTTSAFFSALMARLIPSLFNVNDFRWWRSNNNFRRITWRSDLATERESVKEESPRGEIDQNIFSPTSRMKQPPPPPPSSSSSSLPTSPLPPPPLPLPSLLQSSPPPAKMETSRSFIPDQDIRKTIPTTWLKRTCENDDKGCMSSVTRMNNRHNHLIHIHQNSSQTMKRVAMHDYKYVSSFSYPKILSAKTTEIAKLRTTVIERLWKSCLVMIQSVEAILVALISSRTVLICTIFGTWCNYYKRRLFFW